MAEKLADKLGDIVETADATAAPLYTPWTPLSSAGSMTAVGSPPPPTRIGAFVVTCA